MRIITSMEKLLIKNDNKKANKAPNEKHANTEIIDYAYAYKRIKKK
jgi:hypothetical protein